MSLAGKHIKDITIFSAKIKDNLRGKVLTQKDPLHFLCNVSNLKYIS